MHPAVIIKSLALTIILLCLFPIHFKPHTIDVGAGGFSSLTSSIKDISTLKQPDISLQAQLDEPVAPVTAVVPVSAPIVTGSHTDWMAEAGISPSDYTYVDYIIGRESGWDPTNWYGKSLGYAYDPATSAAGLPQSLPYSKTGCAWGDPICQLVWANGYAAKYGGWYGSYLHWMANSNW